MARAISHHSHSRSVRPEKLVSCSLKLYLPYSYLIPLGATVIPGTVKAQISLRIVPDQDLDDTIQSLVDYLRSVYQNFRSPNNLEVRLNLDSSSRLF